MGTGEGMNSASVCGIPALRFSLALRALFDKKREDLVLPGLCLHAGLRARDVRDSYE